MKKQIFLTSFILITFLSNAQNKIATTEDGKRVLLRDNNTWEFIDNTVNKKEVSSNDCNLDTNFKEPKPDKSIQSWLKRGDATIEDLRKHIAVEQECETKEIIFLKISEQKGNGMYQVCVKGKEMKYRRIGSAFLKADEDPFLKKN